jgi:hypothetical protein
MADLIQSAKCRCLRSKSSYSAFGEYREDLEAVMGSTSTFWCLKTMGKAGPDEHFVHASKCREGRSCFEAAEE